MTTEVEIFRRNVYGVTKYYPACGKAALFAKIARTKTLSREALELIMALGFEIVFVEDPAFDNEQK